MAQLKDEDLYTYCTQNGGFPNQPYFTGIYIYNGSIMDLSWIYNGSIMDVYNETVSRNGC